MAVDGLSPQQIKNDPNLAHALILSLAQASFSLDPPSTADALMHHNEPEPESES